MHRRFLPWHLLNLKINTVKNRDESRIFFPLKQSLLDRWRNLSDGLDALAAPPDSSQPSEIHLLSALFLFLKVIFSVLGKIRFQT